MTSKLPQIVLGGLVLAVALAAGWLVTSSVRGPASAPSQYSECWRLDGSVEQIACVSDRFIDEAKAAAAGSTGNDRSDAVNDFVRSREQLASTDPMLAGICHPAMHELGRAEGRHAASTDTIPRFPEASTQLCTAGYVHGLAEGYLVGTPTADVTAVFPKLCHDESARTGCAHGMGHALLRARVDDRPVEASAAAVSQCADLPASFPDNCMNGVYMELAMRVEPTRVSPDDYVSTCKGASVVDEELACWGYLGLNLTTNGIPLEDAPEWCLRASLPGQFQCLEEHGRDLGTARVAQCESIDARIQLLERCVDGAVALHVGSGHVSSQDANNACDDVESSRLRSFCRGAVKRYSSGRKAVEAS